jgi:hypothetical protein
MAVIRLFEQTTGPAAEAGYGKLWVKDDAPNVLIFTDDAGTEWTIATDLSRGVSLGAAPSAFSFKVLDGGAGVADILYASMQKSDDSWDWVEVIRAP